MERFDNLKFIYEKALISKIYCTLLHLIDELFQFRYKIVLPSIELINYYELNPIIATLRNLCSKLFLYAFDKILLSSLARIILS
jgi:hypothetical protein